MKVAQLLSADDEQYVVPAYQRRYSWQKKQLRELIEDISLLEDSDTHLLGSIVCLTGYHGAGINKLELVDGQQRLTTICILFRCIADRLIQDGESRSGEDVNRLLQAVGLETGRRPSARFFWIRSIPGNLKSTWPAIRRQNLTTEI